MLFIIMHSYCYAQNQYNKELLRQTWKLEGMVNSDNSPVSVPKKELWLIEFTKDSIYEEKRGLYKLEGIWYFDAQGLLVTRCTKINGNKNQSSEHKYLWKLKELNSDQLILINLDFYQY